MRPIRAALAWAAALTGALVSGCTSGDAPTDEGSIARDVFVAAYVDLRLAALESEDFKVTPAQRDEILSRHGTDQEGLLRFAEVHGPDLEYMSDVWAEIERVMQERTPSEATASGLSRPGA
jgi:hypothetical protein